MQFTKNQSAQVMVGAIELAELQNDIEKALARIVPNPADPYLSELPDGFTFLCQWLPIMGKYQLQYFIGSLQTCLAGGHFYKGIQAAQLTEDEEEIFDYEIDQPLIPLSEDDIALFRRLINLAELILDHRSPQGYGGRHLASLMQEI